MRACAKARPVNFSVLIDWRQKHLARYRDAVCVFAAAKVQALSKGRSLLQAPCPIEKRGTQPPGQHGNSLRRGKALVGYGQQLREKQRSSGIYFTLKGNRNYFERAHG